MLCGAGKVGGAYDHDPLRCGKIMPNISVHLHRNSTAQIICTFGDETRPILEFFFCHLFFPEMITNKGII